MKFPSLFLALSVFTLKSFAGELPKPLLYFDFNDNKNGKAEEVESTGSSKAVATTKLPPPDYKATNDYWTKKGDGLSGTGKDFALDFSKSNGMGSEGTWGICAVKDAPLNGLKSLTLTGWYKSETPIDKGARLFDFVDSENTGFLLIAGEGNLAFQVNGQGWKSELDYPQTGEWVFFALTFDGSKGKNNVVFYRGDKKGKLESSTSSTKDPIFPADNLQKILFIGNVGGYSRPMKGLLDNLAVYGSTTDDSAALSEKQIKEILKKEAGEGEEPAP